MGISSSPSSFYPLTEEDQWNVITFFPSPSKKKEFTLLFPLLLSSISKIKKGDQNEKKTRKSPFFSFFFPFYERKRKKAGYA